jgi:hypothetical protein
MQNLRITNTNKNFTNTFKFFPLQNYFSIFCILILIFMKIKKRLSNLQNGKNLLHILNIQILFCNCQKAD